MKPQKCSIVDLQLHKAVKSWRNFLLSLSLTPPRMTSNQLLRGGPAVWLNWTTANRFWFLRSTCEDMKSPSRERCPNKVIQLNGQHLFLRPFIRQPRRTFCYTLHSISPATAPRISTRSESGGERGPSLIGR